MITAFLPPIRASVRYIQCLTFSFTFSNDAGDTTEKQTRKTSVWG